MYTHRKNIRISGLVEEEGEIIENKIVELANDIDVNISASDISVAHIIGKNNNGRGNLVQLL